MIVSLTVDTGTFGTDFASILARAIGYRLVDQSRLERTVADHGWDDDGVIIGFLNANRPAINKWPMTLGQFAYRLEEHVLSQAAGGRVLFAGWAAAKVLESAGLGMRLRITSNREHRARRISQQFAYSTIGPAFVEIEHLDGAMARYLAAGFDQHDVCEGRFDHVVVADGMSETDCIGLVRDCVATSAGASEEQVAGERQAILGLLDKLHAKEAPLEAPPRAALRHHPSLPPR